MCSLGGKQLYSRAAAIHEPGSTVVALVRLRWLRVLPLLPLLLRLLLLLYDGHRSRRKMTLKNADVVVCLGFGFGFVSPPEIWCCFYCGRSDGKTRTFC